MRLDQLNYRMQIQITDDSRSQTFTQIHGSSPSFRSEELKKRDRQPVRNVISFLWQYSIDSYLDVSVSNGNYQRIAILGLSRSQDLGYCGGYLYTNINAFDPKKTLRIGKLKNRGTSIGKQKNGKPKFSGTDFYIKSLEYSVWTDKYLGFPDLNSPNTVKLTLTPKRRSFQLRPSPIDLVIISWKFLYDQMRDQSAEQIWKKLFQDKGNDFY